MGAKQFDYYVFIDYSENLIGYSIIEKDKLNDILPKLARFRHYRKAGDKKAYLKNIKKTLVRENIHSYFLKIKIKEMRKNMDIYIDVLDFLKKHENCLVFISVDNSQYTAFRKMIDVVNGKNVLVKQESELIEGSQEYKISLVLDNLL